MWHAGKNELLKRERCGKLQTGHNFSFRAGKHICDCIRHNENLEEKEFPLLPGKEISQATFYEQQINVCEKKKIN